MKLIVAILQKDDGNIISKKLIDQNFYVTKLASVGGFLQIKNVVILCGVDDNQVSKVLKIIEKDSSKRVEQVPSFTGIDDSLRSSYPLSIEVGGATVFVLNVEQFEKL